MDVGIPILRATLEYNIRCLRESLVAKSYIHIYIGKILFRDRSLTCGQHCGRSNRAACPRFAQVCVCGEVPARIYTISYFKFVDVVQESYKFHGE